MKFENIGFNFIEQLNSEKFINNLNQYHYFTPSENEKVDITFLRFVKFDNKYDAIYYNASLNNSNISYYGNGIIGDNELINIKKTMFNREVIDEYIKYLQFSNQSSDIEVFIHFWKVTSSNFNIKIEPADIFKRKR